MNPCLLTLALTLGCAPAHDQPAGPGGPDGPDRPELVADAWIAEDKLRHFALSFAATQMTYGGARAVSEPGTAAPAAAGVALALGFAKEIADLRRGEPFSLKDLTWDAAGVALGFLFVRQIH